MNTTLPKLDLIYFKMRAFTEAIRCSYAMKEFRITITFLGIILINHGMK